MFEHGWCTYVVLFALYRWDDEMDVSERIGEMDNILEVYQYIL